MEFTTITTSDKTLTILNSQGQIIQETQLSGSYREQKRPVNLLGQAAGVYFLQVRSKENQTIKRIVIK